MTNMRFKIDVTSYGGSFPFALQLKRPGRWWGWEWETLNTFRTRDEAHDYYLKIKDLPEYLE